MPVAAADDGPDDLADVAGRHLEIMRLGARRRQILDRDGLTASLLRRERKGIEARHDRFTGTRVAVAASAPHRQARDRQSEDQDENEFHSLFGYLRER